MKKESEMTKRTKPKRPRAVVDGRIATILNGKRVVFRYFSGEQLVGTMPQGREGML